MYNIKKLNQISSLVYDKLPKTKYNVTSHLEEGDVDAYLVRSADCHDIELNNRILAFARAGAGVNNIPVDRCTEAGIAVFNTPGANANAVKELVLCGMLIASRDVLGGVAWAQTLIGEGDKVGALVEKGKNQFVGPELQGKTLGVIGLGAIGVMVANAAAGLGMEVIGYDPFISIDSAWHLSDAVSRALALEELLEAADYISIHIPLMEQTKNFLSAPKIAKMKEGVVILNFARNGLINESSLFDALAARKVARYVTDFPSESCLKNEYTICIPHLGASTPESEENCAKMAAEELSYYIEVGGIKNAVNLPECILAKSQHSRLTLIHKNLPNMVSQMTSILGEEDLNIEEMVNKSRGEVAYTVFDLNRDPSDETIEKLLAIEGMIKVRKIECNSIK
ncbi:MAG: phosphoglycerate dehydrogenase [Christensenellaceae bacterium]|jgi:D-3-phosphoglycerate dehydrogenase